jgi:hypothetical protein
MFGFKPVRSVEVLRGNARVLSRYSNMEGEPAEAEAVLVEHDDGGRLAFFGWGIDCALVNTGRRNQILAAADWVARDRLPVLLRTTCQVAVVPRCDSQGRVVSVLLLNLSLDPTPELRVALRGPNADGWVWTRPEDADLDLPADETLTLPPLDPWSAGVLLVGG